jgi:hypothetical protein
VEGGKIESTFEEIMSTHRTASGWECPAALEKKEGQCSLPLRVVATSTTPDPQGLGLKTLRPSSGDWLGENKSVKSCGRPGPWQ